MPTPTVTNTVSGRASGDALASERAKDGFVCRSLMTISKPIDLDIDADVTPVRLSY
ncbi:MAG: hypothetical protein NVS3B28_29290 [Candidatus Velthaea sp.]